MGKDRDFKGVFIPKEIWITSELTAMEKVMWAEINSLDREFGCIANNRNFQDIFQLSERQVREYIKRLKDKDLVSVEINKANDTRVMRIEGKYARISDDKLKKLNDLKREIVENYRSRD